MITKDEFINSDFYRAFQELKNAIEENKGVDNKNINVSIKQDLQALARLKKVVKYIDAYMNLIDYDLLTTNEIQELNNISYDINTCRDNLSSSQIHDANHYIDSCLPMIKNILPRLILPRESIKNILGGYGETIQQSLAQIDFDTALKANQQIQEIEKEQRIEKINEFFNKIYERDDENESLESKKNNIYEEIEELDKKIKESSNKQDELDKYHIKIYGEMDTETNKRQGGLQQEIETRKKELADYNEEQKKVIEGLKKEIKSHMPNAMSVGLAKAFSDEKEYFKKRIKTLNWGFYFFMGGLIIFGISKFWYDFNKDFTITGVIISLLSGMPITAPLIWLVNSFAVRRNKYLTLLQEYTHKETFANSYSSYKKQIGDIKDAALLQALLKKSIEVIGRNPTSVLNKKHSGDIPVEALKILEAISTKLSLNDK